MLQVPELFPLLPPTCHVLSAALWLCRKVLCECVCEGEGGGVEAGQQQRELANREIAAYNIQPSRWHVPGLGWQTNPWHTFSVTETWLHISFCGRGLWGYRASTSTDMLWLALKGAEG